MTWDWGIVGGFLSGALSGCAAQYGRLCTMGALERALLARDFLSAKIWGLALLVAALVSQTLNATGLIDLSSSIYLEGRVNVLAVALGGTAFGIGMALAGTCGFGLLLRAGTGDLRAAVTSVVVGISAFAVMAGALAPVRVWLSNAAPLTLSSRGYEPWVQIGAALAGLLLLVALARDQRLRKRPRLLIGGLGVGLAIPIAWLFTTWAVRALDAVRVESLTFVAPVGRALLQVMIMPFQNIGFSLGAVAGVLLASFIVASLRKGTRFEAFDDQQEMRRHLLGGVLMGVGGVLAQGCTVGQGLSAGSTLALSTPIFVIACAIGARIGLAYLMGDGILGRRRSE